MPTLFIIKPQRIFACYASVDSTLASDLSCIFHQNMVIWRHTQFWNGFGFFGQGGSGKTTLTFEFALKLLRDGILDIRIFDDSFLLANGVMRRASMPPYGDWGSNRLGKIAEFERGAQTKGRKLTDFKPIDQEEYRVADATIWFLSPKAELQELVRKSCNFDNFLELLAENHPCHNEEWKPTAEKLLPSFKANWRYEQVWLPTRIDILWGVAQMAYQTVFDRTI